MYRLFLFLFFMLLMPLAALAASADVQLLKQARSQVKVIAGELQHKIAERVSNEGIQNALDSCRLTVDGITDRLSTHSGWEIRRTALRVRNPDNRPDPWEKKVLELFQKRQAAGTDLTEYEFAKVFDLEGKRVFRYMKPIIMQEFCTTCHGHDIAPGIMTKIAERYPRDQAVGFETGELRGAFSLLKVLPGEPP